MKRIALIVTGHPVAVTAVWAAIGLFGLVSLSMLPVEMTPVLEIPRVRVVTELAGMPASEIESLLTVPIEDSLASVAGVRSIESLSKHGISAVELGFDWGVRAHDSAVQIRERIDAVYPLLPQAATKPVVFTERLNETAVAVVAITPPAGMDLTLLQPIVDAEVATVLRQQSGIGTVTVLGAREPRIHVDADPQRLAAMGVTVRELSELVAASVYDRAAGSLVVGETERLVQITTGVEGTRDIAAIPLYRGASGPTLGDLARVSFGERRRSSFFMDSKGQPAIGLLLFRDPTAGTLNAARAIRKALSRIESRVGDTLEMTIVDDRSVPARKAIFNLLAAIALGMSAATVVLRLLLRDFSAMIATVCSVPVAVVSVFLLLHVMGLTLNVMSLSGIAVGIGLMIDNSIVIVERVCRQRESTAAAVAAAIAEMSGAILASTITTLLVFVPVIFIPGSVGALFAELALMVCGLLIVSFCCSTTLTPALLLLLRATETTAQRRFTPLAGLATPSQRWLRRYRALLIASMRKPGAAAALLSLTILLGIAVAPLLPRSVLPQADPRGVRIAFSLNPGATIEQTEATASRLLAAIHERLPLESAHAYGGYERSEIERASKRGVGTHSAEILLRIDSPGPTIMPALHEALTLVLGSHGDYTVSADRTPLETVLCGPADRSQLRITAATRETALRAARALGSRATGEQTLRQFDVQLDIEAATSSGVSARDLIGHLRAQIDGINAGFLTLSGRDYGIVVRSSPESTAGVAELQELLIPAGTTTVHVGSLAKISEISAPYELYRFNRRPALEMRSSAAVTPDGRPAPAAQLQEAATETAADVAVEPVSLSQLRRAARDIARVFALALILIYLTLAAQFESSRLASLLITLLPVSLCGSLLLMAASGHSINLNTVLGMLITLGTTINSGIILTAAYRSLDRAAIVRATLQRVRPVLATTLTTIAALLPLAFDPRPESRAQSGMAIALIGGLLLGTTVTMLAYPALYRLIARRTRTAL